MVRITVEMVRKKAEHHECLLAPLEEVSLHQESIEKIEHIQDWCPKLKILLLQSNLIAKIENLNKLKHLNYLNLALNNIEIIENLERCESLKKIDLTLNFIGEVTSVESLKDNYNLENLYLTGNPCTDFDNYRDYIIATLPQLSSLDGIDIERSNRIKALQHLPMIRSDIIFEQTNYRHQRMKQKTRLEQQIKNKWENEYEHLDEDERNKKFWAEKSEHAPEVRYEMERMKQLKLKNLECTKDKEEQKREIKLFATDGRPFNINQPKVDFKFNDELDHYILDLSVFKYLDTSLLDVDLQPNYIRVSIKGKIFQLGLPEEIKVCDSSAQRSQITGNLVIKMPKLNYRTNKINLKSSQPKKQSTLDNIRQEKDADESKREYLEIGNNNDILDLTKIVKSSYKNLQSKPNIVTEKLPSPDFIDNPEVPALI